MRLEAQVGYRTDLSWARRLLGSLLTFSLSSAHQHAIPILAGKGVDCHTMVFVMWWKAYKSFDMKLSMAQEQSATRI
jgi:hypothetical protein